MSFIRRLERFVLSIMFATAISPIPCGHAHGAGPEPFRFIAAAGHKVVQIASTPRGNLIATGGDGMAKLWDTETSLLLRNFIGFTAGLALSEDGKLIAYGDGPHVRVVNTETGASVKTFKVGNTPLLDNVHVVHLSKNNERVTVGTEDGHIVSWNIVTSAKKAWRAHESQISSLTYLGKTFVSTESGELPFNRNRGNGRSRIKVWTLDGAQVSHVELPTFVASATAGPTSGSLLLHGIEGRILLWSAKEKPRTIVDRAHNETVGACVFEGGKRIFTAGYPDRYYREGKADITTWDAQNGKPRIRTSTHMDVQTLHCMPDRRTIAVGTSSGLDLLDPEDQDSKEMYGFNPSVAEGEIFVLESKLIWKKKDAATIESDLTTGRSVIASKGDEKYREVEKVVGRNRHRTFKVLGGGVVELQNDRIKTGEITAHPGGIALFDGHYRGNAISGSFSGDETLFVTAGDLDGRVRLWDVLSAREKWTVLHVAPVLAVAISPDNSLVASGGGDGTIKLWSADSGSEVRALLRHDAAVTSIAFSGGGARLLSGSEDGSLRIWDVKSGKLLAALYHYDEAEWLAVTPAGFFAGSDDAADWIGAVSGHKSFALSRFFKYFGRPDLLEEVLKGDTQGIYRDAAFRLDITKAIDTGPAPQLELVEKLPEAVGGKVRLSVKLIETGGGLGERVEWRVNGVTQGDPAPSALRGMANARLTSVVVTESLRVDPAKSNIITVTGYNGSGLIESVPLVITVDVFGVSTEERPKLHILTVGVDRYKMKAYELRHAVSDAAAIAEALGKVGKSLFGTPKITALANEQVTRQRLAEAFEALSTTVNPQDVFVMFLGGHGKSVAGNYFFYPQDLEFPAQTYADAISQDEWQKWLAKIPAAKKLLILDTCESGAAGALIRGNDAMLKAAMSQLQRATGDSLIAAADGTNTAIEGYKGRGVLTYALLEALSKDHNGGTDDRVTVSSLADYVELRVPAITESTWGVRQLPVRRISGNNFPLGVRTSVSVAGRDESIPTAHTHFLNRDELVRVRPAQDAPGSTLPRASGVTRVKELGIWTLVARGGQQLGYVPTASLEKIK